MTWFLLNMPFAALVFLAWTLIPLWLVIKHPDTGPAAPARHGDAAGPAAAGPASAPSAQAERVAHSGGSRLPEPAGHRHTDVPTAA